MLKIIPLLFLLITQIIISTHIHLNCNSDNSKTNCTICQIASQTLSLEVNNAQILKESIKELVHRNLPFIKIFFYQYINNSTFKNKAPPLA